VDTKGHHTEAGPERLSCGTSRSHSQANRHPLVPSRLWLLECSHVYATELFLDFV
jgi:hypothetical protein